MTNEFLSLPAFKPMDDGVRWYSTDRLKYIDPWGNLIVIPTGFKSDFASIPNLSLIALLVQLVALAVLQWIPSLFVPACVLASFATVIIAIAEQFLHEGTWDNQAFLHDWLYRTRCRSFWKSNWILFKAMKAKGAAVTPLWKRCLIFGGVTVGGYFAWIDDNRRKNAFQNNLAAPDRPPESGP